MICSWEMAEIAFFFQSCICKVGKWRFCDELAANVLWFMAKWLGIRCCAGGRRITGIVPVNLRPAASFATALWEIFWKKRLRRSGFCGWGYVVFVRVRRFVCSFLRFDRIWLVFSLPVFVVGNWESFLSLFWFLGRRFFGGAFSL